MISWAARDNGRSTVPNSEQEMGWDRQQVAGDSDAVGVDWLDPDPE